MASWTETLLCGYCGKDLPQRGWKWRHIPGLHRSGRHRKRVHEECAEEIDAQGTIDQLDEKRSAA